MAKWIDDHAWPQPPAADCLVAEGEKAILVLDKVLSEDRSVFKFQTALGHFEVMPFLLLRLW